MQAKIHPYQDHGIAHILDHDYAALFLQMGLGKTLITLTAIDRLIYSELAVSKVLVIAPLKVAETTWTDERDKWDHLQSLTTSLVLGSVTQRIAALRKPADIYIINRENVVWLTTHYQSAWPFDMIVIDELSSFKNPASQRFKALKMVRPLSRRVIGLTGTPAPNGLQDIWSQIYLLDMGQRLGKTITGFRNEYLYPAKADGHIVYKYGVREDKAKIIYSKIGDICISMKAKDYLQLPKRIETNVKVKLPDEVMKQYLDFEETEVLNYLEGVKEEQISAVNAAALLNKLLQFANGAIYKDAMHKEVILMHDEKIKALEEIIEAANGEPILVFYSYQHDLKRLQEKLGGKKYETGDLSRWNDRQLSLLFAHPASVAYGLNMQHGGHTIVWFGVPYSLELWDQGNARLDRQGQEWPVNIYKLICPGTADMNTVAAIDHKTTGQNALMDAVKSIISKYKK